MELRSGRVAGGVLVMHGGAPSVQTTMEEQDRAVEGLVQVARQSLQKLATALPEEMVIEALCGMEADPQFFAGRGSPLQSDGAIRVTAALMTGEQQRFSGVINGERILHPSRIAQHLQGARSRVIGQPGVQQLARELGLPDEDLSTPQRQREYEQRRTRGGCDTVGAVVRGNSGMLAAGTSTGGRAFEFPGRVSDAATVAGNYASCFAAISTSGIGEEIVDDAVAARIETRCRDGMTLELASRRCLEEALARHRSYGWIAVDREGNWVVAHTTPCMSFLVLSAEGIVATSPVSRDVRLA